MAHIFEETRAYIASQRSIGAAALIACAIAAVVPAAAMLAPSAGDAARGQSLFQKSCAVCHGKAAAGGGLGPNLIGLKGRKAGTAPGFAYSPALKRYAKSWDAANLDAYLTGPTKLVPGTRMVVKVTAPADRRDIIAYLETLKRR